MRSVFVDTSAWVAIFDKNDRYYAKANETLKRIKRDKIRIVVSDYILDESITMVMRRASGETALRVGEFILSSGIIDFVWLEVAIKKEAWEFFKKYYERGFSFTDCTSFVLMKSLKMSNVFAFDKHFNEIGFNNIAVR